MPWSQTTPMDQKTQFIADYLRQRLSITELCELYGISRKTGYKVIDRYLRLGPQGLEELSRRPASCPNRTPEHIEQASEHRFGFCHASGAECLAAKQEAAEAIGHSKRITVQSIAGFELPLEVGTPQIVRCKDLADGLAGMTDVSPTALLRHQPMPTEYVAHGRARRKTPTPMALVQYR